MNDSCDSNPAIDCNRVEEKIGVLVFKSGSGRRIPDIKRNRYNRVHITRQITIDTDKKLTEANRLIEKKGGKKFGIGKIIDELVAFSMDEYVQVKLDQMSQ